MENKQTRRWHTYESHFVELGSKKVADIHITQHAFKRWHERISSSNTTELQISDYLWQCLQRSAVEFYYQGEEEAYIIDDDLVFIAIFSDSKHARDLLGNALHCMEVITFLGKTSEIIELRDLKSYYAWLRHSRRMNLIKNNRKMR